MKNSLIAVGILLFTFNASAEGLFAPLPNKVPTPPSNPSTPAKIELGKKLFFDARLSKDGTVSCNSCHSVMSSGTDNRPNSIGVNAQHGGRSAPTVWNAAFMSVQFWDGRAKSLEEQAKGPLTNPIEMAMENHDAVIKRVASIPGYVSEFEKVFGKDGLNIDHLAQAIAAYERTLITPNSPVDRYLQGNKKALNASAVRGMKKVQEIGCTTCHMGPNYAGPQLAEGNGFYQKFPVVPGTEYEKKYSLTQDQGRFEATHSDSDKNLWRVPTWRNVATTAPYFHNGSVATLDEAIRVMAKTQLNKDLKADEVSDIAEFLKGLTGEHPKQALPVLPDTPGKSFF